MHAENCVLFLLYYLIKYLISTQKINNFFLNYFPLSNHKLSDFLINAVICPIFSSVTENINAIARHLL